MSDIRYQKPLIDENRFWGRTLPQAKTKGLFPLAMVMGGQDQGIFPLTLIPSWESIHHFADLAVIGSFLLTVAALYLAPPPPSQTPVQTRDNGVAQPIGRLSIRRLRRPAMLTLAFVFGFLTIGLFVYTRQPAPLDVHLATAYWYRNELDKIDNLIEKWDAITKTKLDNYLANRGDIQLSSDTDLGGIENSIKEMVRRDFSLELDFTRHPKFEANPFYSAPKVDQILKDSDKVDYRRLFDQYSEAKYTLNQVVGAYKQQISIQEDYIIKSIQKPTNCHYQKTGPGNIGC